MRFWPHYDIITVVGHVDSGEPNLILLVSQMELAQTVISKRTPLSKISPLTTTGKPRDEYDIIVIYGDPATFSFMYIALHDL